MSEEFYYLQLSHDEVTRDVPFSGMHSPAFPADPSQYLSFSEILLTEADGGSGPGVGEAPATPNSSTEGKRACQDDMCKNVEGAGEKKDEKQQQGLEQERVAFMTKSEVDHLQDGYRWRKYGQKAVKNSPFPRSYYRCTTQKCLVKKRVERSFEDPSVVVTTYEGKHNHHVPTNIRGHVARMLSPSMFPPYLETCGPNNFLQEVLLLHQMPDHLYNYNNGGGFNDFYHERTLTPHDHHEFQQFQDYGLLQDVIPPVFPKHES